MQFKTDLKETIEPHLGQPEPTAYQIMATKKIVEKNPHCKTADVGTQLNVNHHTAIRYLHKLRYHERTTNCKPLLIGANIKKIIEITISKHDLTFCSMSSSQINSLLFNFDVADAHGSADNPHRSLA